MSFSIYVDRLWTMRQQFTALIVVLVCSVFVLLRYIHWNFDDSFIVFRVVDRLLNGSGWSFNDGEALNVSTSVLNTILITVIAAIGVTVPTAAHIVGFFGLALVGCSSYFLFIKNTSWVSATISSCLLIVFLADNRTWGLETHLFIGLLFFFMALKSRETNLGQINIGFLILARPDGLLIPIFQIANRIIAIGWRNATQRSMLLIALIIFPWAVFSWISFHQLFPATLTQKMWQARSGMWGNDANIYAEHLLNHLCAFRPFGVSAWIIYPLALIGLVRATVSRSALLYLVFFAVAQQVTYLILIVPGYHWYTAFLDATFLTFALLGFHTIVRITSSWFIGRWKDLNEAIKIFNFYLTNPATLVLIILFGLGATMMILKWANNHPLTDLRTQAYQKVSENVKEHVPLAKSFAAFEVGVFGYYLKTTAIDLTGLTSVRGEFITGKRNDRYFDSPADVFIAYAPPVQFEKAIMQDSRFLDQYHLVSESKTNGFSNIKIYSRMTVDSSHGFLQMPIHTCDSHSRVKDLVTIDTINGQKPASGIVLDIGRLPLSIRGWVTNDDRSQILKNVLLVLKNNEGKEFSVPLDTEQRPDVAAAFNHKELIDAGFNGWGRVKDLDSGIYSVQICGYLDSTNIGVLHQTNMKVSIY